MKLSILTQTLSDRWMERLRGVQSSATLFPEDIFI